MAPRRDRAWSTYESTARLNRSRGTPDAEHPSVGLAPGQGKTVSPRQMVAEVDLDARSAPGCRAHPE
jgi:hypothetical protein